MKSFFAFLGIISSFVSFSWAGGHHGCKSMLAQLADSSPYLTVDQVLLKNVKANSEYETFRAFPLHFKQQVQKLLQKTSWAEFEKFKVLVSGDSHGDNFGYDPEIKKIVIVDYDEVEKLSPFYDYIRFFASIHLSGQKFNLESIKQSYLSGLKNPHQVKTVFPQWAEDDIKVFEETNRPENILDQDNKMIDNKWPRIDLRNPIVGKIEIALTQTLNKPIKVLDILDTMKESGGSGFLQRYDLVLKSGNEIFFLKLKESTGLKLSSKTPYTGAQLNQDLQDFLAPRYDGVVKPEQILRFIPFNNGTYIIQPVYFKTPFKLTKKSGAQAQQLAEMLAESMGREHSLQMPIDGTDYLKLIDGLEMQMFSKEIKKLVAIYKTTFEFAHESE